MKPNKKVILTSIDWEINFSQTVVKINSVVAAYRELDIHTPDLLVLDWKLCDGTAFDILSYLRKANRCRPVIILSHSKPAFSSLNDRISFVDKSINANKFESLVEHKLVDKNYSLYTIHEYVDLVKKAGLTIEISVCKENEDDCDKLVFSDGLIIDSKYGDTEGGKALSKIFAAKNIDIRFRTPENFPPQKKTGLFADIDDSINFPNCLFQESEIEDSMMKQNSASPRTTVGHGTDGVPFIVEKASNVGTAIDTNEPTASSTFVSEAIPNDWERTTIALEPILIYKDPNEQLAETSKALSSEDPIDLSGADIGELLDLAMEKMLSRQYDLAYFVLKAAIKIDPGHTTALANLIRLEALLKEKN